MVIHRIINNLVPVLRTIPRYLSGMAVFVAIWAVIVMALTILWYLFPVVQMETFVNSRWIVALIILTYLIVKKRISIN